MGDSGRYQPTSEAATPPWNVRRNGHVWDIGRGTQHPHALATSALGQDLAPFSRRAGGPRGPGGWWIIDEPELHLGRDVVVPDLAGWRHERLPEWPDAPWMSLAPDWVCEVLSPTSGRRDRLHKARIYLQAGVQWLWLVDPLQQSVEVWQGDGDAWRVIGGWEADDPAARIPPFAAEAFELERWWGGRKPT